MADPFDSLISNSGANVLMSAAGMLGQQQSNNRAYAAQIGGLQQDMMQFTMQQNSAAAAERQQERQFTLQSNQEDRRLAALREESAFAQLNQSLDRQLKYAELESRDQQTAFENTLRAQQVGMQTQMQVMQIQQIETAMNAQKAIGLRTQFKMNATLDGLLSNPEKYSEELQKHLADNKQLYDALGQTPEGQKMLMEDAQMVQSIKMYATDLYTIDPDMVADSINLGKLEEIAKNMRLGEAAPKGNERQVLAYMARRADREVTDEDVAAEFPTVNLSSVPPAERAMWKVRTLAAKNDGLDYWDSVAKQLENPVAAAQFETLHSNGLLEPVADKNTLARLQAIDQSRMQMMSQAMAASNGAFLIAPEYAEAREAMDDNYATSRNELLSGGNPSGAFALGGAVDFGVINDKVKEQASLSGKRRGILQAAADISGIPGAFRAGKGLLLGEETSLSDKIDLAMWAIAIPTGGGSFAVKGATGIGKLVAGKALTALGRSSGKAMAKAGSVALSRAGRQLLGREAIAAGQFAQKRLSAAAFSAAAERSVTGLAAGGTAAQWASRASVFGTRAKALQGATARMVGARVATAGLAVGAGRSSAGGYTYRELDHKAQKVSEIVDQFKLKSYPPAMRAKLADELGAAMRDYQSTAAKYFPDGNVPAGVLDSMLSMRKLVPPTVLRQLQRDLIGGNASMYGGVQQVPLASLLGNQMTIPGMTSQIPQAAPATAGVAGFQAE